MSRSVFPEDAKCVGPLREGRGGRGKAKPRWLQFGWLADCGGVAAKVSLQRNPRDGWFKLWVQGIQLRKGYIAR